MKPNHKMRWFEEDIYGYKSYHEPQHSNHDKRLSKHKTREKEKQNLRYIVDELYSAGDQTMQGYDFGDFDG